MILFIDSSDLEKVEFVVIDGERIKLAKFSIPYHESHTTLKKLMGFLKKEKVKITEVKKIIVCGGPGSFTGVRVSMSLAQGIALASGARVGTIAKNKIPKDWRKLNSVKTDANLKLIYNRPAVY